MLMYLGTGAKKTMNNPIDNKNQLNDQAFYDKTQSLVDEEFLKQIYKIYLRREPDTIGKSTWLGQLRTKNITRLEVLQKIRESEEFDILWNTRYSIQPNDEVFLQNNLNLGNESFLRKTYQSYLKREPDINGLNHYVSLLSQKKISRQQFLNSLRQSSEFQFLWKFNMKPGDALHQARILMVQNELPPASVIVDLGGASEGNIQGALLSMGYPYTPKQITIIDLPSGQRLGELIEGEVKGFVTPMGTRVSYIHGSMADLSPIASASVDMVFSGETIEHVSETDAEKVMQEAYRVLKPDGYFCLDTPNRALTKLHSPDQLTHPEHQKEYLVNELINKLVKYKFKVVGAKAICPMPMSLAKGNFNWLEIGENIRLSDSVEEGYLFFLKCCKNL